MKGYGNVPRVEVALERGEDWRARAACVDEEAELFFTPWKADTPAAVVQNKAAKAVCARCLALDECREWAIESLTHGVAGGMTQEERSLVRKNGGQKPLFLQMPTEAAGNPAERADAGRAYARHGMSVQWLMSAFGVSERTAMRWVKQVRAETGAAS